MTIEPYYNGQVAGSRFHSTPQAYDIHDRAKRRFQYGLLRLRDQTLKPAQYDARQVLVQVLFE